MLFKPILASIWKSCQGTLGEGCNSLFPSLLSFIPPSSISLSSDLASGFCPHICYLIPLLNSFHLFILVIISPSKYRSLSPATGRNPSLFISLPVCRWVRVSLSCPSICLSVFSSVHASVWVCPSAGGLGGGGWEAGLEGLTSCVVVDSVLVWSCPSLWSPAGWSTSPHPFSAAAWTASGCLGSSSEHTGGARNQVNASGEVNHA